jgi:O-antigen/teichoic acid export membrane protein
LTEEQGKRKYGTLARRSMFWALLREATNSLLVLPTSIILARLLSPAEFGIAAIAYVFLALGARLTQFGLNAALLRTKELRPELVSTVFVASLTLGGTAWAVLAMLAPAIAVFVRSEEAGHVIPVAGLSFLISAVAIVPNTLLSRDLRYRELAVCDWIGTVTNAVVSVGCAWSGFSYWSIVYGILAAEIAQALAKLHFARWVPSLRFSFVAFRELISFGSGVYVKSLLDYAAHNIDNLIVGRMLGMSALGVYGKAYSLVSRMLARINLAGPSTSFRIFALIHEDHERFRRAYRKVVLAVTVLGYPILTALILMAPDLIHVLFGSRWMGTVLPFRILCVAGMLRLLNTYASSASQAKGMIWSEVGRHAISTALLAVCVAVMSRWGVGGAAAGVLTSTVVTTLLIQRLVRRLTGLRWGDLILPQVPAVVCSLGLVLVVGLIRLLMQSWSQTSSHVISLAVSVGVAAAYYLLFVLYAGFSEVRAVVLEVLGDLAPFLARGSKGLPPAKVLPAGVE